MYIRRSKQIATEEEREKWQQLDNNYMTDESSDGEDGLLSHHPAWRSNGRHGRHDTAEGVIVHKQNFYHYISVFVFQS